jgi:hypothetical protein
MVGMLVAMCSGLWVSGSRPAFGHPFDATFTGHQLELAVQDGQIEVGYLAEVPTREALGELKAFLANETNPGPEHQDAFTALMLDELAGGLRVLVDGTPLELRRVEIAEVSGVGDSRFIKFQLKLYGQLPPGARTVHVVNSNRMGGPALFSDQVWVDDTVIVDAVDLVDVEDGRVVSDRSGQWRGDEELREVRVSIRARPVWLGTVRRLRRAMLADDAPPLLSARDALSTAPVVPLAQAVESGGGLPTLGLVGVAEGAVAASSAYGAPLVLGAAAGLAGGGLVAPLLAGIGLVAAHAVSAGVAPATPLASTVLVVVGAGLAALGGVLARRRPRVSGGLLGLAAGLVPAPVAEAVAEAGWTHAPVAGLVAAAGCGLGVAAVVALGAGVGVFSRRGTPRATAALVMGLLGAVLGLIAGWNP